ncbi:LysR family transcriptional regulator [Thauera sp. SDU_THAU2]|uniref:LysR family transcriptional regulator n=1 Tax=Thauera sp. SDU_THAU2 TaxID=3136633 RepID=UPI0031201595
MRLSNSLSKLELFVKVVECGSLSKAARALCLTPSAVSKALAQLEDQLGTTLIKRTTRHIALTECGAMMYERATAILRDADLALSAALRFRKPSGVLQVSSSVAFGCTQVSRLVREFTEKYPEIEVALNLDDRMEDLAAEGHDVALRISSRDDWEYPGRKLAQIHWVYAASPKYLNRHSPIRTPMDLEHHACLLYPAMTEHGQWSFACNGEEESLKVRCVAVSNSSLALAEMAIDHCGVVCLPTYVARRYLDDGSLQHVLPQYSPSPRHSLYVLYFKTRYSNPTVRAFVDFLGEKFESGVPWETRHAA